MPKAVGIVSKTVTDIHLKQVAVQQQPRSQASVFCSSVFVQYNTRKRKSAKNGEGLGTPIT